MKPNKLNTVVNLKVGKSRDQVRLKSSPTQVVTILSKVQQSFKHKELKFGTPFLKNKRTNFSAKFKKDVKQQSTSYFKILRYYQQTNCFPVCQKLFDAYHSMLVKKFDNNEQRYTKVFFCISHQVSANWLADRRSLRRFLSR